MSNEIYLGQDKKKRVPKTVINKLKLKYKPYLNLIKNIEISRYESNNYDDYFYDNVSFNFNNIECCIDRYLENNLTSIKYSFGNENEIDTNSDDYEPYYYGTVIICDNTTYKLSQTEQNQMLKIFKPADKECIDDYFNIIQELGELVKNYCHKYKTVGYW